jgi:hypothetical protein
MKAAISARRPAPFPALTLRQFRICFEFAVALTYTRSYSGPKRCWSRRRRVNVHHANHPQK